MSNAAVMIAHRLVPVIPRSIPRAAAQTRPRVARGRAFTLAEVMMAAAIMALALAGTIEVIVSGIRMIDLARKQNIAGIILHDQIEQLRLLSWGEIRQLAASGAVLVDASDHQGDQSANLAAGFSFSPALAPAARGFTCARSILDLRDDLKTVTFTVSWTAATGESYSRRANTYALRHGLAISFQR